MQKQILNFLFVFILAGVLSAAGTAAPSFLSTTGTILTPDDLLVPSGAFSADFHSIDVEDTDSTTTILGANFGITPSLEIGIARLDPDSSTEEETVINAKYRVLPETASRPSVVVGAVDITGELDPDDDPGVYVIVGKNLTRVATDIAGEPVMPLRGYLGVGSGVYDGLFGGLAWTVGDRTTIMLEFINELNIKNTIAEDSLFNVGARFALSETMRADAVLIDGDDFAFGISYVKIGL